MILLPLHAVSFLFSNLCAPVCFFSRSLGVLFFQSVPLLTILRPKQFFCSSDLKESVPFDCLNNSIAPYVMSFSAVEELKGEEC